MNLNRRIEKLESDHSVIGKTVFISMKFGDSKEQAMQKYCFDKGMTIDELNNLAGEVMFIVRQIVSPGDIPECL